MKDQSDILKIYEKAAHWPPYSYRDYPDVTSESLNSFISFLDTENSDGSKIELQPWVPFCDSKCAFCYFSTELFSYEKSARYLLALKKLFRMYAQTRYIKSSEFPEIYFGGGDPAVLSSEELIDLLSFCEREFNVSKDRIVKVTGSTHNFEDKKMELLAKNGVNQLDLGIQTFDNDIRKTLNLRDNSLEAERKIKSAHKLGLAVSIDLMYNLPKQTLDIWGNDIQKALQLDVESVDCYPLHVYPDTFLAGQLKLGKMSPIGSSEFEMQLYLEAYNVLTKSGYMPAGHNRFSRVAEDHAEPCFEILGTGAGFFMGFLGRYSYTDIKPSDAYTDRVENGKFPISRLLVSSEEDEMRRMITMRLFVRLPVNKDYFKKRFRKLPEDVFKKSINSLKKKGLIEVDDQEIKLTTLGDMWRYNIVWEFSQAIKTETNTE